MRCGYPTYFLGLMNTPQGICVLGVWMIMLAAMMITWMFVALMLESHFLVR